MRAPSASDGALGVAGAPSIPRPEAFCAGPLSAMSGRRLREIRAAAVLAGAAGVRNPLPVMDCTFAVHCVCLRLESAPCHAVSQTAGGGFRRLATGGIIGPRNRAVPAGYASSWLGASWSGSFMRTQAGSSRCRAGSPRERGMTGSAPSCAPRLGSRWRAQPLGRERTHARKKRCPSRVEGLAGIAPAIENTAGSRGPSLLAGGVRDPPDSPWTRAS